MCGLLYDGLMIQYPVHDICWYLARTSERTRADIELLEFGQTDRRARVSGWDLLADSKRGSDPKVCVILAPLVQVTVTDVFHSFRLNHSSSTRDLTCCRYQVPFPVFCFFSLCSCSCNSWLQTPTLNPPARYPSQREFAPTTFTEENIAQCFAPSWSQNSSQPVNLMNPWLAPKRRQIIYQWTSSNGRLSRSCSLVVF